MLDEVANFIPINSPNPYIGIQGSYHTINNSANASTNGSSSIQPAINMKNISS